MKAVLFKESGDPDVLTLAEIDPPRPRSGESVVEVHASSVNPSDVANLKGAFGSATPRVPGRDYAGIVVDGDPDWIGKEVWGASPGLGGDSHDPHAERVAVKTATLVEKPKELSMEEAATFGIPYLVSWSGLVDTGEVETGETVLVTGAAGAVGQAATQIAHWQGAHVIGVDIVEGPTEADTYIRSTGQDIARPSARPRRTVKAWISPSTRWAVRCSSRHWAHCG